MRILLLIMIISFSNLGWSQLEVEIATTNETIVFPKTKGHFLEAHSGLFYPIAFNQGIYYEYDYDTYQSSLLISISAGSTIQFKKKVLEYSLSVTYINLQDSSFRCSLEHGSCNSELKYASNKQLLYIQAPFLWYAHKNRFKFKYGFKIGYLVYGKVNNNGARYYYDSYPNNPPPEEYEETYKLGSNSRFDFGPQWGFGFHFKENLMLNLNHSLSLVDNQFRIKPYNQEITMGVAYFFQHEK